MTSSSTPLLIAPLALLEELPHDFPPARFQIGQSVYWTHVPSHDFGRIIGLVYSSEATVQALGYHYAVQLDPSSPSYVDGTRSDWAFEDDLELLPANGSINSPTNGQE